MQLTFHDQKFTRTHVETEPPSLDQEYQCSLGTGCGGVKHSSFDRDVNPWVANGPGAAGFSRG